MKEINDQLYGYSYELDQTTEEDRTTCYAVDTGTVFVAYKGVWYEQPGSLWAASISPSDDDILGLSYEVNKTTPASDLTVFNAVDTGVRYVSFNGAWYAQPVQWSAPAAGGGGGSELPAVTSDDNGDVLTVVEGAWAAAAPGGGGGGSGAMVEIGVTVDEQAETITLQKTGQEILDYVSAGLIPYIDFEYTVEEISLRSTALLMSYSAEPGSSATTTHTFYFGQRFFCDALSDYPAANL